MLAIGSTSRTSVPSSWPRLSATGCQGGIQDVIEEIWTRNSSHRYDSFSSTIMIKRHLRVSVATRCFCRVLIFVSS